METDNSSGKELYFFHLTSTNVPATHSQGSENYFWTPSITATQPTKDSSKEYSNDAEKGVLLPVSRWQRLRALPGSTPQSWTHNTAGYVLTDGLNIHAQRVAVKTINVYKKPSLVDWDKWFEEGQDPEKLATIKSEMATANAPWTPVDIPYEKTNESGNKAIRTRTFSSAQGSGFSLAITPPDSLYPATTSEKYIRLRNDDYMLLSPTGKGELPDQAYISETAFAALKSSNTYPWPQANTHRVAVRDETGMLRWIDSGSNVDMEKPEMWAKYYNRATVSIDTEAAWTRRIDPAVELCIRPAPGATRLDAAGIQKVFNRVMCSKKNGKQWFKMIDTVIPSELHSDYKLVR
jgi:hypothetical protein